MLMLWLVFLIVGAEGSKNIAVAAYRDYLAMLEKNIVFPKFRCSQKPLSLPSLKEAQVLIYGIRSRKLRAFLMVLRDTAVRPNRGLKA